MKKIRLLLFVLLCVPALWNACLGQTDIKVPKNFPGIFAGVEWNTISGLAGVSYERTVWAKERLTIGIKGIHAFKHENGNLKMFIALGDGTSSFSALLPTVHYYTSHTSENNRGFFLHSGLGVARRIFKDQSVTYGSTKPSFEAGVGWQFHLGSRTTLVWSNTLLFAGAGGITLTKVALGF
jgi:hypothetical protein